MAPGQQLPRLAEQLFGQLRLFGNVSLSTSLKKKRIEVFAEKRINPTAILLSLAPAVGVEIEPPDDFTFLHTRYGWPTGAPAAGWMARADKVSPHDIGRARISFLLLQESDQLAAVGRLIRGLRWILDSEGYLRSLEYGLDSVRSGLVADFATGVRSLLRLMSARRSGSTDERIGPALGSGPASWLANFRSNLKAVPALKSKRADLTDDIDWLQAHGEAAIEACRSCPDSDQWIRRWGELSAVSHLLSSLFRRLGFEEDLAYGAFAGQVEELKADGGGLFLSWGIGSRIRGEDRLNLTWAIAGALAAVAQYEGPNWFDEVMDVRVPVPDALAELYRRHPTDLEMHVPAEWQAPSPPLRAALADILFDDPYYPYLPVGDPQALPDEPALRKAAEEQGQLLSAARIAFLHQVIAAALGGVQSIVAQGDPFELLCWIRVPKREADALGAETGLGCDALSEWIEDLYGKICLRRTSDTLSALISIPGGPASDGLAGFLRLHPNFPHAYAERAIELDKVGSTAEAWTMMATALAIDPSDPIFWHSGAVILRRLGEDAQSAVAAAMSMTLQGE